MNHDHAERKFQTGKYPELVFFLVLTILFSNGISNGQSRIQTEAKSVESGIHYIISGSRDVELICSEPNSESAAEFLALEGSSNPDFSPGLQNLSLKMRDTGRGFLRDLLNVRMVVNGNIRDFNVGTSDKKFSTDLDLFFQRLNESIKPTVNDLQHKRVKCLREAAVSLRDMAAALEQQAGFIEQQMQGDGLVESVEKKVREILAEGVEK
ncbi:MAG: hypothetical protein CVV64_11195 [Candidatus Wallbacteria bacterium HGW-Wallbacteria-1]|jgi:hypothetical protein|uniref:Uncharacterized protein n=1 Tax=Candidatus Wallbacteria bacterium HGW-Wallbacteria-1 TaxID=2013854 RepID=A0A2N1PNZ8_9BACT|nr:MAG: hypothetical protein CVV64_11195 [Candidatus Wallbacteria bacterium HGW-Wallbacteria-1]